MPQTISIQRGSTTITSGSIGTLFTNGSGGLGTRVIINQLAFTGTNSAPGNRSSGGVLIINGSGVGQTPIGVVSTGSNPSSFVSPFLSPNSNTAVAFGTSGTVQNSYIGPSIMTLFGANGISNGMATMLMQTFWIGPSDAVQTRPFNFLTQSGKSSFDSAVTVRYSFTLITES